MKNILLISLLSICTILPFTSSAKAETVVAKVSSVDAKIKSAELTDAGSLKITNWDGASSQVMLKTEMAEQLLTAAQSLNGIELQTDHHMVVCMMMVAGFSIQDLYVLNTQTGEMEMTLSAQLCSLSTVTYPKEDYLKQRAETFRSQLLTLAIQLAE